MDARVDIAGLYSMDQLVPPGRYPALEEAFWRDKRHILIILTDTYSTYVLSEYEKFLTEFPELPHRIEVIADELLRQSAEKKQE